MVGMSFSKRVSVENMLDYTQYIFGVCGFLFNIEKKIFSQPITRKNLP